MKLGFDFAPSIFKSWKVQHFDLLSLRVCEDLTLPKAKASKPIIDSALAHLEEAKSVIVKRNEVDDSLSEQSEGSINTHYVGKSRHCKIGRCKDKHVS